MGDAYYVSVCNVMSLSVGKTLMKGITGDSLWIFQWETIGGNILFYSFKTPIYPPTGSLHLDSQCLYGKDKLKLQPAPCIHFWDDYK